MSVSVLCVCVCVCVSVCPRAYLRNPILGASLGGVATRTLCASGLIDVTSNKCIAVRKVATPLREFTRHMGSHSVTCHPAEVTFPPLPQPKLVLDSATPEGCKAELT